MGIDIPSAGIVAAAVAFVGQAGFFIRWTYRRMRDDDIHRAFIRDMAVNHLPYTHRSLAQIARKMNVELGDPPSIQWVEINGHEKRPSHW
jgi:hypothetical protein